MRTSRTAGSPPGRGRRGQARQAAHADGELALRPVVGQVDNAQRHGAGRAAGGGFRHDADPDPALHQPADRIEAAQLHAQPQRAALAYGLGRQEPLQRGGAVQADQVAAEHVGEGHRLALGQRVDGAGHHHEAVRAEREGLQAAHVDGAGDDADVADALGHQPDDLVGEPLLEVDADVRMVGQEAAQRLGDEFGQGVGVGQQPHFARQAAGIGAEVLAQAGGLREDGAGVLEQGAACGRGGHPLPRPLQQRRAQRVLHIADPRRGRGQGQGAAFGPAGDGSGVRHLAEQPQINQVEPHPSSPAKDAYGKDALHQKKKVGNFGFGEGEVAAL